MELLVSGIKESLFVVFNAASDSSIDNAGENHGKRRYVGFLSIFELIDKSFELGVLLLDSLNSVLERVEFSFVTSEDFGTSVDCGEGVSSGKSVIGNPE